MKIRHSFFMGPGGQGCPIALGQFACGSEVILFGFITASRTLPWLASVWECRHRPLSRG